MVSAIKWFIILLIKIECVPSVFVGNKSSHVVPKLLQRFSFRHQNYNKVPKAANIHIMGNEVNGRIKFEYKYCLLSTVDQTREHCLNAIRRAMNLWDGNFVNNALKLYNREIKFTLNQNCCKRRPPKPAKYGKPKELFLYGYSIKPECVDLIITFIKPGDPSSPFKNRLSSLVKFDGGQRPKQIVFNDKHKFTVKRIKNVIGHELGHFLGLDDNWIYESIMCNTCSNTRVDDVDRRNLVQIFRKKNYKDDLGGLYQSQNSVERSSRIEDLDFQLQNLQLMALPDFISTTQNTVTFIIGDMLWSYNWNDVPLLGIPQKFFVSNTFPLDLANMIKGSPTYQGKADSVFEFVFHKKRIWSVIRKDKIKMFDGVNVMEYELRNLYGARDDSVKTVLLLSPKHIVLFTNKFYVILDMEKWYSWINSRINSRKMLYIKRKHYTIQNDVMRHVKLVYYIYPGDFTVFQAYTDSSFLGTFRVTSKHWSLQVIVEEITNMQEIKLPDFQTT